MEKIKAIQVDLTGKIVGAAELPKADILKYIGKKAIIEDVKTYKGDYDFYALARTEVIDTVEKEGFEPIKVRASRLLGLHTLKNGNVCWGKNSKTSQFLERMKCKTLEDLVGKEVVLLKITTKKGKEYLSIESV